MSGIAGVLLHGAHPPLLDPDLDGMLRGLGGEGDARRILLDDGRLGLVARGFRGYATGIATRPAGGAACALAFHGMFLDAGRGGAGGDAGFGEALLERFLARGPAAVEHLRGEFVLAFWDGRERALHLFTDRFRVQSLLAAQPQGALLFASRMRALLAAPVPFRPTIHAAGVMDVVGGSIIATPHTIFNEVAKVEPGTVLTCRDGHVASRAYWDLDFTRLDGSPPERLRDDTREALAGAVDDRLALDAGSGQVGAFLSGGVDSSCVSGLIARNRGGVRTFSIGFGEERFNELSFARIAARSFGADHTEYFVTPADALTALPLAVDAFDEPFANASAVPTYWCARIAREHGIDAMYAGDGGDELWAGNERYASDLVFAPYDRIPGPLRRWVVTPAIRTLAAAAPLPLFVKAGKYVTRASIPPARRLTSYGFWYIVTPPELLEPDFLRQVGDGYVPFGSSNRHYEHARARTHLDRQLYVDLKVTIGDNDVFKVTRMCEQAGVAVRFPFLDERVADMAERVPARLKMRGRELRTFFKETYADLLPAEVRSKTKHGFGLPIAIWLKTDPALNEMMRDLVLGRPSLGRGYFRRPMLEELLRRHEADTTTFYGTILWNLMILELWHRRVLDAPRV